MSLTTRIRAPLTFTRRHAAATVLAAATLVLPLLVATPALASGPLYRLWTLSGVTFDDGGTLSGTLAIASDGSLARAVVTTAGGNTGVFGTYTYNTDTDSTGPGFGGWIIHRTGFVQYLLIVLPDTTGATNGTTLPFSTQSYECMNCSPGRSVTAGNIVAGGAAGAATTVSVSSDHNPAGLGGTVTFTATVSSGGGTPSGQVTFRDMTASTDLCSGVNLDGSGVATCSVSTSTLGLGHHSIRASFGATPAFQPSADSTGQLITKAAVSVSLRSSPQPSIYHQDVYLVAKVSSTATGLGRLTGSVDFLYRGRVTCFDVPLDSAGKATCHLHGGIDIGRNLLVARYSGDASHRSGDSPVYVHYTNPNGTTTTLTVSPAAVDRGQPVHLTATVDNTPSIAGSHPLFGKVQFFIDGTKLSPQVGLVNGKAKLTVSAALTRGSHHVRAFFVGSRYYVASSSAARLLYVK